MIRECPRCDKFYSEPPAMSRVDNTKICPRCGMKEAVEAAEQAGVVDQNQAEEILEALNEVE